MSNMLTYRNHKNNMMFPETRFFDEFMRPFFGETLGVNSFRVDVKDEGESFLLTADIPGANRDDVHVDVDDGVLTISAEWNSEKKNESEKEHYLISERRYGSVTRSFSVENINEDEIKAEYVNGVLKLTLPKKTPEKKLTRKIEIQ